MAVSLHVDSQVHPHFLTNPDSDLIIRSSENVDFHVSMAILSRSSPNRLGDLLRPLIEASTPTQPRTSVGSIDDLTKEGAASIGVLLLDETSIVLAQVLGVCYPGANPEFKNIYEIAEVAHTMQKYDMYAAATGIEVALRGFLQTNAQTVLAISLAFDWQETAKLAKLALFEQCVPFRTTNPHFVIPVKKIRLYERSHGRLADLLCGQLDNAYSFWECHTRDWWSPLDGGCTPHRAKHSWTEPDVDEPGQLCTNTIITRSWFIHYIIMLSAELRKRPSMKTLDSPLLKQCLSDNLDIAWECPRCAESGTIFKRWTDPEGPLRFTLGEVVRKVCRLSASDTSGTYQIQVF